MIEIQKKQNSNELNLLIEGKIVNETLFIIKEDFRIREKIIHYYEIIVSDREISRKIIKIPKPNFNNISSVKLEGWFDWTNIHNYLSLGYSLDEKGKKYDGYEETVFALVPNLENWQYTFSFADYCQEFLDVFNSFKSLFEQCDLEFRSGNEFGLFLTFDQFHLRHSFVSIEDTLERFEKDFRECHLIVINNLKSKRKKQIAFTSFDFPENLKTPCEQYLLYFAQFLQDLGINATSNLEEKAGKVLFSVAPTDDVEALDKIREALAVYLKLPESPIIYDDSFAAMRLKSEIERLQSSQRIAEMEFRVAQKALESQDKIIFQQSILLEQQAKTIEKITSKSVMIDSAENKEELEEICDGLKIGKSKFLKEQLGIDFNPATFAKGIGNKILGKQETNSIIETDEENK